MDFYAGLSRQLETNEKVDLGILPIIPQNWANGVSGF